LSRGEAPARAEASGCGSEPEPSARRAPAAGSNRLNQQPAVPPQSRLPRSLSSPDQAAAARDGLRLGPFGPSFTEPAQTQRTPDLDRDGDARSADADLDPALGSGAQNATPPSADPDVEGR
jgi:hypothetical protein